MKKYNKGFLRCLKESKGIIAKTRNVDAGKIWLSLKDFVCDGDYSAYKKAGSLAELYLGGYTDDYIASHLGISVSTVRVHLRDLSNELFKLLGEDFFDLLNDFSNNEVEVRKRIKVVQTFNMRAEDLLPVEITAFLRASTEEAIDYISLEDCKSELNFLRKHCKTELKSAMSALDEKKLRYLVGVINSDCGTPTDRYAVISILTQKEGK